MKISCQSCEAKYTIADEKVRGKVVKIRCKKCGTAIVVKGTELAPPAGADYDDAPTRVLDRDEFSTPASDGSWTINVHEGDQRVASTAELVELYRDGTIDDATYVWRDGMDDWQPVGELPELKGLLPRSSRPVVPPANPSPQPRAAVRGGRASSTDIFGASALAGRNDASGSSYGDGPQMTGARNESSVLFSLSALTAGATTPRPSEEESSSLVDLKTLMGPSDTAPKPAAKSTVDDIMNLGTGGGIFAPTLAAPDFSSLPPTPETPAATRPESSSGRSNKGLLFGGIGAVVVALGVGAVLLLGNKEDSMPTAEATTSVASAVAPADQEPPKADPPAEERAAVEPVKPSTEQPSEPAPAPTTAEKAPEPAEAEKPQQAVAPAVAQATDTTTTKAATTPAKAPAKAEPKTTQTTRSTAPTATAKATATAPAPARGEAPPFDRAAALAALNSAADTARACKKPDGPTGSGRIAVTFAPSGVVTAANVEGPPFAGTAVGSCVAARFRNARVPAFSGGIVTVRKSFTIN